MAPSSRPTSGVLPDNLRKWFQDTPHGLLEFFIFAPLMHIYFDVGPVFFPRFQWAADVFFYSLSIMDYLARLWLNFRHWRIIRKFVDFAVKIDQMLMKIAKKYADPILNRFPKTIGLLFVGTVRIASFIAEPLQALLNGHLVLFATLIFIHPIRNSLDFLHLLSERFMEMTHPNAFVDSYVVKPFLSAVSKITLSLCQILDQIIEAASSIDRFQYRMIEEPYAFVTDKLLPRIRESIEWIMPHGIFQWHEKLWAYWREKSSKCTTVVQFHLNLDGFQNGKKQIQQGWTYCTTDLPTQAIGQLKRPFNYCISIMPSWEKFDDSDSENLSEVDYQNLLTKDFPEENSEGDPEYVPSHQGSDDSYEFRTDSEEENFEETLEEGEILEMNRRPGDGSPQKSPGGKATLILSQKKADTFKKILPPFQA